MSGASLFGNEARGDDPPLREWAKNGRLEVLMPLASPDNPTARYRWTQYSEATKRDHYPGIDSLISEIETGRDFLLKYGNRNVEHRILCMWRVVLFRDYCSGTELLS